MGRKKFGLWLLCLMLAMPSAAQGRDDDAMILECSGIMTGSQARIFARTYYVDLAVGRFCFDQCRASYALKSFSDSFIDLSWSIDFLKSSTASYNRYTGILAGEETVNGTTFIRSSVGGQCNKKPFELEPLLQFLRNAPAG